MVFFTFFKLYKWYQIAQRITYRLFDTIAFSFSANVRMTTCPGDEVGILSISWKYFNLLLNIFLLTQLQTFSFSFVFSACKLNFITEQLKELFWFWNRFYLFGLWWDCQSLLHLKFEKILGWGRIHQGEIHRGIF